MTSPSRQVLIGDKDVAFASSLGVKFQEAGFEVVSMQDGMQANHRADTDHFDVIIVHSKMDRMSGMQVAATAKNSSVNAKSVIILIVGSSDRETLARAGQIGVAACLVAPVSPEEVIKKVTGLLPVTAPEAAYDVRLINAFLTSVSGIFLAYFGIEPQLGKASVKKSERALGYMSTLIDFTGSGIRGSMAISFEHHFLVALAQKIFQGATVDLADAALADLAGEMGNQICGAVKLHIGKLGLKVMIGLPKVVIGKEHSIHHVVKNPTLILQVKQGEDRCSVEFCMSKAAAEVIEETANNDAQGGDILLF